MGFDVDVSAGVLRVARPETRWLSTGWDGGYARADAAFNISVPTGFDRTDLDQYVAERRADAGFDVTQAGETAVLAAPALLTGVEMRHARVARAGPVVVAATAGVSNPAALPIDASSQPTGRPAEEVDHPGRGTVNLLVGTTRRLDDAGLATLLGVTVEAKTATLLARTGFPGTTTDAVVVGSARDGETATFAGSATVVGDATRACVRDALLASLDARYDGTDDSIPESVADAEYGVVSDRETEVSRP
jgi:adenosylcobinamide hydrolase